MPAAAKKVKRSTAHTAQMRIPLALGLLALLLLVFFRKILLGDAWLWEDFLYQYYPARNFASWAIAHGQIPFWNPYTFAGMPFLADIQNTVLYLPHLLLVPFASQELNPIFLEYIVIAHLFGMGVGMFFLARRLGLDVQAAFVAGAMFMLSGYTIAHAIHQTLIASMTWLPWIVLLTLRSLESDGLKFVPLAGTALAMSIFAGFPQVFYYNFLFTGALIAYQTIDRGVSEGWKRTLPSMIARGLCIFGFAGGLAAIQLLPTMELAPQSARAAISFEKSLEGSLSWGQLSTLLVPKYFGSSGTDIYDFWGPGPYWHYWETCIYPGIAALLLGVIGLSAIKGRKLVIFFAVVGLLTLLIGLGDSFVLHRVLFEFLPGYAKFRNPARATMLFSFGLSLLAGLGVHRLVTGSDGDRKSLTRPLLIAGALLAVIVLLLKSGIAGTPPAGSKSVAELASVTSTALIFVVLSTGLLLVLVRGLLTPRLATWGIVLVWFVDMYTFGFAQNNGTTDPRVYFHERDRYAQSMLAQGKSEFFRINSRDGGAMMFDRNQGMLEPLFLLEGYTPLALTNRYPPSSDEANLDLLNVKYRLRADPQGRGARLEERTNYLPRAFFVGGAKVIPLRDSIEAFMGSNAFRDRRTVVVEDRLTATLPDTASMDAVPATISSYSLNQIVATVEAPTAGLLVYSELYYPGWKATIDGVESPVLRADGCLRAVPISSGTHNVMMSFLPASFMHGFWITLATVVLAVAWFVSSTRRKLQVE